MRVEIETSKIQREELEGEELLSYFTLGGDSVVFFVCVCGRL